MGRLTGEKIYECITCTGASLERTLNTPHLMSFDKEEGKEVLAM
jgi:hypothetical protein